MLRLRSKKLIGLAISFPPLVVIEASVVVTQSLVAFLFKVVVTFGFIVGAAVGPGVGADVVVGGAGLDASGDS